MKSLANLIKDMFFRLYGERLEEPIKIEFESSYENYCEYYGIKDFIRELLNIFYESSNSQIRKDFQKSVGKIIIGASLLYFSDDLGVYDPENKIVYLTPHLLNYLDLDEIAEVLLHELGHAILERYFPEVDSQIVADFLALHAKGSLQVFKSREEYSRKCYERYKDKIFKILGDNTKLQSKIGELIKKYKERLYEILYSEIKEIYNIDLKNYKPTLRGDVREILESIFPQYRQIVENFEREENPRKKLDAIFELRAIEEIFTTPLKELSGRSFYIPSELSGEIEKRTGIFVGYPPFLTPENDIPYTLIEIIKQNMRFNLPHPLFKKSRSNKETNNKNSQI